MIILELSYRFLCFCCSGFLQIVGSLAWTLLPFKSCQGDCSYHIFTGVIVAFRWKTGSVACVLVLFNSTLSFWMCFVSFAVQSASDSL